MQTDVHGIMLVPLSGLHLWEKNYRRGNVEAVKASIVRFGFRRPLSAWRQGKVMAGNHTLKALMELSDTGAAIPGRIVADPSGEWLIPCVDVSDLEEEEAMAYAIADNATSDLAENDMAALNALVDEIAEIDPDLLEVLEKMGVGIEEEERDEKKKPSASDGPEEEPVPVRCPECGHMFVPD
ncbi:hypothetical protein EON81_09345 [bacterium]|nr:MAG: hypothetical protein EON81_09345 [bacterium]